MPHLVGFSLPVFDDGDAAAKVDDAAGVERFAAKDEVLRVSVLSCGL